MTYLKLVGEDIRLLRFDDSLALDHPSEPLRLSLEKFSLNDLSEDFMSHANGDQPRQTWNDTFFRDIEYRRAALNAHHNAPQRIPSVVQSSTRFTWGDYEALSYTWGDGSYEKQVHLNDVPTPVSCNLEAALRMLQRLPETRCGMKYWIDALCIKQDDDIERNSQVKRMQKIYCTARSVVVWLGNTSPDDEIAFRAMRAIYQDGTRNNWLVIPPDFGAESWRALCAFMRKPYWSRLWIIQELVANPTSTLFVCGTIELTRETLKLAVRCCQKLQREEARFTRHDADMWEISSRLFRLINLASDVPKDVMLRKALSLSRQAMVTKEKDKVYGILALLDDSVSSGIRPDYNDATSIQEVFTELTVAVINATRSVEQIVYSSTYNPGWPSWVPDLRLPFLRHHMHHLRLCQASGNRSARFSFHYQSNRTKVHLCVKGIKVDYIDGLSASPALRDTPILRQHRRTRYGSSSVEALGKTLVLGHPKISGNPVFMKLPWRPKNDSAHSVLWNSQEYAGFDEFRRQNEDFIINDRTLESYFPQNSSRLADDRHIRYHLRLAGVTLEGRKLITTETGYLGLVPQCVQKRDVIVVLLGCNFPVLLRRYNDGYRVLGECYIHGLMAGEVFNAQRRESLPYHTFTLL
jgi:hypothetical protein